jgi:hypothetical protein
MVDESRRGTTRRALEQDAELLVVYQLDLLAQIEGQLRAVHHTMRAIEKLRGPKSRVGPELSNGQRQDTMEGLSHELTALDRFLAGQHESCRDMQEIIEKMQARLADLKTATMHAGNTDAVSRDAGEPPDSGGLSGAP